MQRLIVTLLLLCILGPATAAEEDPGIEYGRELTQLFYEQEFAALWRRLSPQMKDLFGELQGLKRFREQVALQLGPELSVISEKTDSIGSVAVYERRARFEESPQPVLVQWAFAEDGAVEGFQVLPAEAAPDKQPEYETKTSLQLPFQGEWYVFWGGRTRAENRHRPARDQRFAYDFVVMKDRSTHEGTGAENEDYYCFGEPILAPGPGIVRSVEAEVEDNVPGVMNARQPLGNHVILDHGNGEFSFLAHLRRGSVQVEVGDEVDTGDVLGECGNSGNSSEPHLHYHLQNTGKPFKGQGLPAQFEGYLANGEQVSRGEPVRGQLVRPEPE